jgi:two-component system CheB/CheR fusion protein
MSEPAPASSRRILIVDDSTEAADSLALLLQVLGHQVMTVYDGPDALAVALTFRPDIIILDIRMPKMDGYEVARQLRAMPEAASTVLVALTGFGRPEDIQRARDAGFDHHFLKPVEFTVITQFLARLP